MVCCSSLMRCVENIRIKKIGLFILLFFFLCIAFSVAISASMHFTVKPYLRPSLEKKDFIIALGASVHGESLSGALRARMNMTLKLYQDGVANKILMSGDGTNPYYNETAAMKKFAHKKGVPNENLFADEKGYNTYAALLRAKTIFGAQTAYIVSQDFHIERAVWIARQLGIDAVGVGAGGMKNEGYYIFREHFAKVKDFLQVCLLE